MLKTIIIDDEPDARFLLNKALTDGFEDTIQIIGEADGYQSGLNLLKQAEPDLVFLDVKMPDGTGFDILKSLGEYSFAVVFITAFDNFAIKAFESSATGYLVKPFKLADLESTINRVLHQQQKFNNKLSYKVLIESYTDQKIRKIVVPNSDGFTMVMLDDILYLKSDRNYTEFHLKDSAKLVSSKSLILYDQILSNQGFFRIHHSFLINLSHLKSYIRSDGGSVKMINNEILPVSRQKKAELMERFY